mmetsp:Transcript_13316/g.29922  ORF Transcript_13316/g.29922 Transcript_13316/m.29922 type:complete len:224 (+) Transcript_13316:32-703(+)
MRIKLQFVGSNKSLSVKLCAPRPYSLCASVFKSFPQATSIHLRELAEFSPWSHEMHKFCATRLRKRAIAAESMRTSRRVVLNVPSEALLSIHLLSCAARLLHESRNSFGNLRQFALQVERRLQLTKLFVSLGHVGLPQTLSIQSCLFFDIAPWASPCHNPGALLMVVGQSGKMKLCTPPSWVVCTFLKLNRSFGLLPTRVARLGFSCTFRPRPRDLSPLRLRS